MMSCLDSELWQGRFLLRQLVVRNVQMRFRGSCFGGLWSFLAPILLICVYTLVFGVFFKSRWGTGEEENRLVFAAALFSGVMIYNFFNECVANTVTCIVGNAQYVKKVKFPLVFLPVGQVLCSTILVLPWMALVVFFSAWVFRTVLWSWLLLPFTLVPLVLFCVGIALALASLGVYFRDLEQLVQILLRVVFFMSPVCYRLANLSGEYQRLILLNPLAWFIELTRKTLFCGLFPEYAALPTATEWLACFGFGLGFAALGALWFGKTAKGFSDVL